MVNKHFYKIFLGFTALISITACSPFGNQSLVQDISGSISPFFKGKVSSSLLSSASGTYTTPDNPATQQPYYVTHSVGDAFQQTNVNAQDAQHTDSGYKVYSSVQSDIR